jgi:hypothetical protein
VREVADSTCGGDFHFIELRLATQTPVGVAPTPADDDFGFTSTSGGAPTRSCGLRFRIDALCR